MSSFQKVCEIDVSAMKAEMESIADRFGEIPLRTFDGSPHEESTDLWLRYCPVEEVHKDGPIECEWYPLAWTLPCTINVIMNLHRITGGDLGGILVTKLPKGGQIKPHVDKSWHSDNHRKFYVPVKNGKGAKFCFEDGVIEPEEGEVYEFDNSIPHWVENDSDDERIAMIVCVEKESCHLQ